MAPFPPFEFDYLRRVELLAREVVACAGREGWLRDELDLANATPLQRVVNEIAGIIRYYHFEGDGCEEEGPELQLGGAALIGPGLLTGESAADYIGLCARFGVEARPGRLGTVA